MHPNSPLIRPRRIAKKTILVADDHARIRETLGTVLSNFSEPVTVLLVKNGVEAVEHALAHNPDLAVLDLAMPVTHGVVLLNDYTFEVGPPNSVLGGGQFGFPRHSRRP